MSILQDPARVVYGTLPPCGRTIVISDIHSNVPVLDALLQQVSYVPGQDKLIILGDFLLKGKLNLSTLHRIMELAALPEVTVLRGNCDDILEIIARNYPSGGMENFLRRSGFCKEVWTKAGMTAWDDLTTDQLLQKLEETIPQELAFLHSLPDILVTERAIFVHGGIYDGRQDHFETLDSFDCRKCDEFWLTDYAFDKYLVVGHWPVSSYPRPFADHKPVLDHQRRIISIDGGCSAQFSGQLNALIIQGDGLEDASCAFADALPKVQALEAQESNGSTRRMYWGNDYVDVLSKTDDAYQVRQQCTGETFTCPASRLRQDDLGRFYTGDLTDLTHRVQPGDILSVIARTNDGIYCKHNGIEGWYFGRAQELSDCNIF